ncbi:MAG TPA: hypothetical protein EYG74_04255 [Sulfurimonas autotrophica]|nr:hypothetical protein [Sulfurimonas autotrophica]
MKRSILSALVLIIVGLVLSGCGVAATQYKVENQKFDSTYPFNKYSIQVYGNKGLMFGYNIVTYLPYSEKNLEKLKKVLAELKNNNKINGVECRDSSNTSVFCNHKYAKPPTQTSTYYLKSDREKIYLVESLAYIKPNFGFEETFFKLHNNLVEILKKEKIILNKSNEFVEASEDLLIKHDKRKLFNK